MKAVGVAFFLALVGCFGVFFCLNLDNDSGRNCSGIVTGNGGKGIADVVVFLVEESSAQDSVQKKGKAVPPSRQVTLAKCGFQPRLIVIAQFQELFIDVDDNTGHSFQDVRDNSSSPNVSNEKQSFKFDAVGPTKLVCSVHSDEVIEVFVAPTEVFAKTNKDGKFEIKGVPSGKFQLRFWHPSIGYLQTPKTENGILDVSEATKFPVSISVDDKQKQGGKQSGTTNN